MRRAVTVISSSAGPCANAGAVYVGYATPAGSPALIASTVQIGYYSGSSGSSSSGDGRPLKIGFVSPKTGRAVSRAAAEPYKGKLLPLPAFLSTGGLPADPEELRQGLDLTGFFLERHVFWPHNKPLPPARARFMESVQR